MNTVAPQAAVATAVPSPCINVCRINEATGLCLGCWRTLDEISSWSGLPDEAKWEICLLIAERKNRASPHPTLATIRFLTPGPSRESWGEDSGLSRGCPAADDQISQCGKGCQGCHR